MSIIITVRLKSATSISTRLPEPSEMSSSFPIPRPTELTTLLPLIPVVVKYSATMLAFHSAAMAVMLPVIRPGSSAPT